MLRKNLSAVQLDCGTIQIEGCRHVQFIKSLVTRVLPKLIFIGIAVPIIELGLLMFLSSRIGFPWTIGIVVLTGVLGAVLWRLQGLGVIGRLGSALRQQDSAADALMDGALIFFAGGLLLTPGVITDLLGFALLIPWSRSCFKGWILRWLTNRFNVSRMPGSDVFGSGSVDGKGDVSGFFGKVFFGQATFGGSNQFQTHQFEDNENDNPDADSDNDYASGDVIEGHIVDHTENDFNSEQKHEG